VWRGVSVPTLERVEAGRRKYVGRGRALAKGTRSDGKVRTDNFRTSSSPLERRGEEMSPLLLHDPLHSIRPAHDDTSMDAALLRAHALAASSSRYLRIRR